MKRKKGFTLIELIAVLVILAILALIVTPLVMNIIRKARISADKRSIDAYGRSVELAIANYLLDNGDFPTDISQLTIEYTGDRVECSTTQINTDSSVYLAGCTVGGRSVENYTYGKEETVIYDAYSIGDEVTYNNVDYYVIKDSDTTEESVTLLKAEPITSSEISPYLSSTEVGSKVNTSGTYAIMSYYFAEDCKSIGGIVGCSTDYSVSKIKQVVDIWKINYASTAMEARLITFEELTESLGFEFQQIDTSSGYAKTTNTPSWVYSNQYSYWTMSSVDESPYNVWTVSYNEIFSTPVNAIGYNGVDLLNEVVRPVIVLPKSALN